MTYKDAGYRLVKLNIGESFLNGDINFGKTFPGLAVLEDRVHSFFTVGAGPVRTDSWVMRKCGPETNEFGEICP